MDTERRKRRWKRLRFWGSILLVVVVGIGVLAYVTYRKAMGPPPTPPGKSPEFDQHLADIDKDWLFLFWEPRRLVACDIYGNEMRVLVDLGRDSGRLIDAYSVERDFSLDASRFLVRYDTYLGTDKYAGKRTSEAVLVDTGDLTVREVPNRDSEGRTIREVSFSPDFTRLLLAYRLKYPTAASRVPDRNVMLDIDDWDFQEVATPKTDWRISGSGCWVGNNSFLIKCVQEPGSQAWSCDALGGGFTFGGGFGSSGGGFGGFGTSRPVYPWGQSSFPSDPFMDHQGLGLRHSRPRVMHAAAAWLRRFFEPYRIVLRRTFTPPDFVWYRFSVDDLSLPERLGLPKDIGSDTMVSAIFYNSDSGTMLFRNCFWPESSLFGIAAYDENDLRPATIDERAQLERWLWDPDAENRHWGDRYVVTLWGGPTEWPSDYPALDLKEVKRSAVVDWILGTANAERRVRVDLTIGKKLVRRTGAQYVHSDSWGIIWEDGVRLVCWLEEGYGDQDQGDDRATLFRTYYADEEGRYRFWHRGMCIGKFPCAQSGEAGSARAGR